LSALTLSQYSDDGNEHGKASYLADFRLDGDDVAIARIQADQLMRFGEPSGSIIAHQYGGPQVRKNSVGHCASLLAVDNW